MVCRRLPATTGNPIQYGYESHKDVSDNDGPHIRQCSHKIIILYYKITVLQLPIVFITVTCSTGL